MSLLTETVLGLMKYDQSGITWKYHRDGVPRYHPIHAGPSTVPGCETRAPDMALPTTLTIVRVLATIIPLLYDCNHLLTSILGLS